MECSLSSILLLLVLCFTHPIPSLTFEPLISSLDLHEEESCPYTVIVTTSCFSPDWSRDQVTIALGDADDNQVWYTKTLWLFCSICGSKYFLCSYYFKPWSYTYSILFDGFT